MKRLTTLLFLLIPGVSLATVFSGGPGGSATTTTSGGLTVYRNINMGSTGQSVKGSAGQLYGWYIFNNAASVRYVKFYNKATAPTVGTDTPVLTLSIPPSSGANVSIAGGLNIFATGIGVGATTGVADADTGAPSANDVVLNVFYK